MELRKGARYVLFVDSTCGVNLPELQRHLDEIAKGTVFVIGCWGKPSDVLKVLDVGEVPGV